MRRLIERGELTTDMECAFQRLLNVRFFIPVPPPLIETDDPRLSDPRPMLDGSVTDASVALDAGIQQHKLDLNGDLPIHYLNAPPEEPVTTGQAPDPLEVVQGDDAATVTVGGPSGVGSYAARGSEAQFITEKGEVDGYCPLDGTGRMPLDFYPTGLPGAGTVNLFGLATSLAFMVTTPPQVTSGAQVMDTEWMPTEEETGGGDYQWFGNPAGAGPTFHSGPIPRTMIPGLNTAKIVSGVFPHVRFSIAVGVGAAHATGLVPDPGADTGSDPSDYLARDMSFKTMQPPPSYQPVLPDPAITFAPQHDDTAAVIITSNVPGASLFYRLNHIGNFVPAPTGTFSVPLGSTVEAYAAKIGYDNSGIASLTLT